MRFSLITVHETQDGYVSGNWVQNYVGTVEEAIQRARQTERVNDNKIRVAVVDEINSTVPTLSYHKHLREITV